jgi:flavodoxin
MHCKTLSQEDQRVLVNERFDLMKVVIVYDSVSPSRVTAFVAETVSGVLKQRGLEVDSLFVEDVDKVAVKDYDCLLAGAPTMRFRVSSRMRQFLDGLSNKDFSGKLAAAFGTQVQSRFSASAAKGIDGKLKSLGFKLVTAPLIVYVDGTLRENKWSLKAGELEKVENWAQVVAETLLR